MKENEPIAVRIGSRGQRITEPVKGMIFTYPDIPGEWRLLEDTDKYILCKDTGRYLTFVEFCRGGQDNLSFYKRREWERRPRDDNNYTLSKHRKYYGIKMPLGFAQHVRNAIRDAKEVR
ncbi:MAG TPA: hypothetical protein HA230_02560 [Candidatus Aenigmarchaeota archaeon]|nr:hypothetical protein [Candidatus Aenigmarchaeota archaeon]